MKNLEYKGYTGTIEYSKEDGLFFGKVIGIQSLISYEGETGPQLETDFTEAIDCYLEDCKNEDIQPEKAFKGSFNVRVSPTLHKEAALRAKEEGESLNKLVSQSLEFYLLRPTNNTVGFWTRVEKIKETETVRKIVKKPRSKTAPTQG